MEEKIIKKEEKFIVSLIRNENLENDYFADIDCQEVLRLLYNQTCLEGVWLNGRVVVSKTIGCGFKSYCPCQKN